MNTKFSPFEKSIRELSDAMAKGLTSSYEITSYFLERIKVYDGILKAFIYVNSEALNDAKALDEERAAGKIRGSLHGIPVVLKDNFNTEDMPTSSGAVTLKDFIPSKDATTVKKLREAGALILGKTNLTEMANHGMTVSSIKGQSLNPYDLTRTPGGSSGGTGAAVAANLAVIGTGTDTVNSIRSPSSANSLVGIRPSLGLVSRYGISPCSFLQDMAGPIAKYVEDAAIMLTVMAGYDKNDSSTAVVEGRQVKDYTKYLNKGAVKGKRFCLIRNNLGSDRDVLRVVQNAVKSIEALGGEVIEDEIEELYLPKLLKENDVQLYEQGPELDKYFKEFSDTSPFKSAKEYVLTGKVTPSVRDDLIKKVMLDDPLNDEEYKKRLSKNLALREFILEYMSEHKIDAFIYPLQGVLAVKTTESRGQYARNGLMASVTGLPAITVPGGFSLPDETAAAGVPVGIEFMAEPFSEDKLIAIAYDFEQFTKHRKAPAAFREL